ncbi:endonuclease domain-containing protein [Sphingomonas koreensis]|nr:endonuclease domain-containing protein [Sphingomonas koreensis]
MRDPRLIEFAKHMRREPSEPEERLWLALRAKRFEGINFRHQKVIGRYIADFSSRDPMLVVEVDGDTHATQHEYDASRSQYFESQGYQVIRFTNSDIMTNLEGVLQSLQTALGQPPLPTLSPEGERAL